MASQITGLSILFISQLMQTNCKKTHHLKVSSTDSLKRKSPSDRWIPLARGQLPGKILHASRLLWMVITQVTHVFYLFIHGSDSNLYHYKGIDYSEVIVDTMASQITSLTIVYSTLYSGGDERKHHLTQKMFPFDDVIMKKILAITTISTRRSDVYSLSRMNGKFNSLM